MTAQIETTIKIVMKINTAMHIKSSINPIITCPIVLSYRDTGQYNQEYGCDSYKQVPYVCQCEFHLDYLLLLLVNLNQTTSLDVMVKGLDI